MWKIFDGLYLCRKGSTSFLKSFIYFFRHVWGCYLREVSNFFNLAKQRYYIRDTKRASQKCLLLMKQCISCHRWLFLFLIYITQVSHSPKSECTFPIHTNQNANLSFIQIRIQVFHSQKSEWKFHNFVVGSGCVHCHELGEILIFKNNKSSTQF